MNTKLNKLSCFFRQQINEPYTGELLFFAGYILYLGRAVWFTTMFPYSASKIPVLISLVLIALKILLFDHYKIDFFVKAVIILLCSMANFVSSRYLNVFLWAFILLGCKDISFRKVLKVYFIVTGTIVLLAFIASIMGVIENLQYHTYDRGIRNSFGITYVTDFAAHIFYLILVYFYLKGSQLRWYHCLGSMISACVVYYFCNARVDSVCILLIGIIYGIHLFGEHVTYAFRRWKRLWNKIWYILGPLSIPAFAALSIIATILYSEENSFLSLINETINGRLYLGQLGIKNFGITLFGQTVDMVGMGGSIEWPKNYFFVDCSYVYILLRYGAIATAILLSLYTIICYKNRRDMYLLFAVFLVALNCVIAHHILEPAYNPFSFVLLACYTHNTPKYIIGNDWESTFGILTASRIINNGD